MYHKPTHTDQYSQWDSHHSLSAKYSVIGTRTNRAKTVCTSPELLQRELQHLRKALVRYNIPIGPLTRYKASKVLNSNWEDSGHNNLQHTGNNTTNSMEQPTQTLDNNNQVQANSNLSTSTAPKTTSRTNSTLGYIIIPYTQGLAES